MMEIMTENLNQLVLPKHVAFVMDGNGRWAKQRGLARSAGHRAGALALKKLIQDTGKLGIPVMTVYAFSTENWSRPEAEVNALFSLLLEFFQTQLNELIQSSVRVRFIGDISALPEACVRACRQTEEKTKDFDRLTINVALNYGGRAEIVKAARELAFLRQSCAVDPASIDEKMISDHLYTAGQPDVDLLIRTGGEHRLSGFLLYQCQYAEFFVSNTLWPDYGIDEFMKILGEFSARDRRFGNVKP